MSAPRKIHLVDQGVFATEIRDQADIEMAYCGLIHWPEASKYSYADRTTDPDQATCKRCLHLAPIRV